MDSISGSGMNSRILRESLGCALCLIALTVGGAKAADPSAVFVSAQFSALPEPVDLAIQGALKIAAADILGYAYPHPSLNYWQDNDKSVWVLEGRGKSHLLTAGFVIENGRITNSEVLVYRESRGREVRSKRFLRQFDKATLRDDRELDRRIDGITGATISVKSITNLARLALYLHHKIRQPSETE